MFEITKPTSNPSNQSEAFNLGTNPPKSDAGVIRGRPDILNYTLDLDISSESGDPYFVNLEVNLKELTPLDGAPSLNILNHIHILGFLPPSSNQGLPFQLFPTHTENLPDQGARYIASGSIKYYEDGVSGPKYTSFNVTVDVVIVE